MNSRVFDELKGELLARGFGQDGASPNDTMSLVESYLSEVDLGDLLDTMVTRREKISRSTALVGVEASKKSYDDVALAIGAIKAVLGRLALP